MSNRSGGSAASGTGTDGVVSRAPSHVRRGAPSVQEHDSMLTAD